MQPILIKTKNISKQAISVKIVNVNYLDNPLHFHNEYEIVLINKSSGRRIVGDHIEDFRRGDLVIIGPNLPHVMYNDRAYYEMGSTKEVNAIVIYFNLDWLDQDFINSGEGIRLKELLQDLSRGISIYGKSQMQTVQLIDKLVFNTEIKRLINLLDILNLLSETKEYKCLASVGYANPGHRKDIQHINKVSDYVISNLTKKIEIGEVSMLVNMTTTAFCKYFKVQTKKTFTNFVNEVRIGHACKLLSDHNLSISQVCFQSGYNNLTNFNRNFKRHMNTSPSDFKKSLTI